MKFNAPDNPSTDASGEPAQFDLLETPKLSKRAKARNGTNPEPHDGPSPDLKKRIQKLAHEMLEHAGEHGVGFDEVCQAAETRGWLTGQESGRYLSFGSLAMKATGALVKTYRRSRKPQSQRRRIAVYVLPQFLTSGTE